ncbi:MAG: elongation factor P [Rhodobacteraceae bacterium]|nr:elongation factor P [Paracoccaceae bacterium]MYE37337.1 elongation factor P [Paracoccaceae bacterium]
MPKINGNEIRPGNILEHKGGLWSAVKIEHVKPGKGGAFAQVELRNLRNGSKLNERFRSADKVEKVRLEQKDQQYLYSEGESLILMDMETYEQTYAKSSLLGDKLSFLREGMMVTAEFFEEEILGITLPQKVNCTVVETEPVISGQTVANSYKPATLDNGMKIMIPPYVSEGTEIAVNTETFEFSERI